jgi:hypothetical protein
MVTKFDGSTVTQRAVVSMNLRRRYLDESQRGMVAARLATLTQGGNPRSGDFKEQIHVLKTQEPADLLNVGDATVRTTGPRKSLRLRDNRAHGR